MPRQKYDSYGCSLWTAPSTQEIRAGRMMQPPLLLEAVES